MRRIFLSFFLFVILSLIIWQFLFSPAVTWLVEETVKQELNQYYRTLVRGVYSLLIEDVEALPPNQWPGYIQHRQPQFGYPLVIEPITSLDLPEHDQDLLKHGSIVVAKAGRLFYQRIRSSDQVLTMGPFSDFEASLRVQAMIWGMLFISYGLMTLIWAMAFWMKLRRISITADAFGRGDLGARVRMSKHSALFPLANSFNNMAEQIQRLIASHKELTRAVSHELRTPISRIRFGMEMLNTPKDAEKMRKNIFEINKDVDELDTLVSELLVYARFDREKPSLDLIELPVVSWLEELTEKAGRTHPDIQLQCHLSEKFQQYTVLLDPHYMSRAVNNLIQNAMKYAAHHIEIRCEEKGGDCLIHVDDDGPGIPEPDRERIFEPFVRLDSSRSRDTGGQGLGLTIVRQIITWHGGRVFASKSSLGGARFTLCCRKTVENDQGRETG